jgi:hypothetical protein
MMRKRCARCSLEADREKVLSLRPMRMPGPFEVLAAARRSVKSQIICEYGLLRAN